MGEVKSSRIEHLDGLRGIAIISVVLYHAYVSFPEHLPFGDTYGVLPLRLGWQGVELFFLISGFVILMSLERCNSFGDFLVRRWLRLFPAMLIASLITLLFNYVFGSGSEPAKSWINLIPGLTFINPSLIHSLTGLNISSMQGAYWSLYIEVVFYLTFGIVYFLAGPQVGIAAIFSLFATTLAANLLFGPGLGSIAARMAAAATWIGFIYFGWFASGALFYLFFTTRRKIYFLLAVASGAVSALTTDFQAAEKIGLLVVVVAFAGVMISKRAQSLIATRWLLFFGFVSYPLYLVHGMILNVLLDMVARGVPYMPSIMWPMPAIAVVTMVAWLISRFGEPALRPILKSVITLLRRAVEACRVEFPQ